MCSREEIKEIIDLAVANHELKDNDRYNQFEDKLDKTLVAVRDSIPPAYSQVMKDLQKEILEVRKQLQPIINAYNRVDGTTQSVIIISKIFGAVGIIVLSLIALKEFLKR